MLVDDFAGVELAVWLVEVAVWGVEVEIEEFELAFGCVEMSHTPPIASITTAAAIRYLCISPIIPNAQNKNTPALFQEEGVFALG
jgi:hypothetical protein